METTNNGRYILTNIGENQWSVSDTETGFVITFTEGDFNATKCVVRPEQYPEGIESRRQMTAYTAKALRGICNYMAAEHYELATGIPASRQRFRSLEMPKAKPELSDEEKEERSQRFYEVVDDIGRAIVELRNHYKLTQSEAAEKMGITEKKLAAMERGVLTTKLSSITRYIELLGGRLAIVPEENNDDPHCRFIDKL